LVFDRCAESASVAQSMQRHASRCALESADVRAASNRTVVHQHGVSNEPLRAGAH
jgi:hypothetical protein